MKMNVKLSIGLVLLLLLLIFIVQNAVVVELHFLFWTLSMSRSLIILFSIFLGVVLGWFLSGFFHRKRQKNEEAATQPQAGDIDNEDKETTDNQS